MKETNSGLFMLELILIFCSFEMYDALIQDEFTIHNNVDVNNDQLCLIQSISVIKPFNCLAQCNREPECMTSVHSSIMSNSLVNCTLYRNISYFASANSSTSLGLFLRKCASTDLVTTFGVKKCLRKNLRFIQFYCQQNGHNFMSQYLSTNFTCAVSFQPVVVSSGICHYVTDYSAGVILIYDINWNYLSQISRSASRYLKVVQGDIYLTDYYGIYKVDSNMVILKSDTISGKSSYAIFYDPVNDNLYITVLDDVNQLHSEIRKYDRSLNLLFIADIGAKAPYSVWLFNNELYVGTNYNQILVIDNYSYSVLRTISGICPTADIITCIHFDKDNYMLLCCYWNNMVKLYHSNGTYLGKYFSTSSHPNYVSYDYYGRLVVISDRAIDVFY